MLRVLSLVVGMGMFLFAGVASADERKEAVVEMMNAAVAHYEEVGQEQAFKDFSVRGSEFNHGEYYIFATDLTTHENIFHGVHPKLIGKNLEKLKDTDGKPCVLEMREVAQSSGEGWVDYKWTHPETKKVAQKHSYVKRTGNVYFGIGYFD